MVGGLIPGIFTATLAYYLSVPVIRAYQHRRRGAIKSKFIALREKAAAARAKVTHTHEGTDPAE